MASSETKQPNLPGSLQLPPRDRDGRLIVETTPDAFWIGEEDSPIVSRLDISSGECSEIELPSPVAWLTSDERTLWVATTGEPLLLSLDLESCEVVRELRVLDPPSELRLIGNRIWLLSESAGTLRSVAAYGRGVLSEPLIVRSGMSRLIEAGEDLLLVDEDEGAALLVDANAPKPGDDWLDLGGVVLDADFAAGCIWAIYEETGCLERIEYATGETWRYDEDESWAVVAAAGDTIWAATSEGKIVEIDGGNGNVVRQLRVGLEPEILIPRDGELWALDAANSCFLRVDAPAVIAIDPVPTEPMELGELWSAFLDARMSLGIAKAAAERDLEYAQNASDGLRGPIEGAAQNVQQVHASGGLAGEVDTQYYNALVSRYREWERKGFFGTLFMGNPWRLLVDEGERLLAEAERAVEERRKAVEAAASAYNERLDRFRPMFDEWLERYGLTTGEPSFGSPRPGYIESHVGWAQLDPEREWAALPPFGRPWHCFTLTPGGTGLAAGAAFAQHWVLGLLASAPARSIRLTWIDTIGRGAGAGPLLRLLDIDKDLLDGQVWSESDHIAERLRRITDHVSYVQQRCLQDRFANLAEYNAQAGELAEPYHVVCVLGYPRGFTEEAAERLRTLVSHSERAGVGVMIVCDPAIAADAEPQAPAAEAPYWVQEFTGHWGVPNVDAPAWWQTRHLFSGDGAALIVGHEGRFWVKTGSDHGKIYLPVGLPPIANDAAAAIVESYGKRSVEARDVTVTFDQPPERGVERGHGTTSGLAMDLGVAGRGEKIQLKLGAGMAQNVLVGGLPGSGKSSLFHTLITQAIQKYDWSELELYLLDFKQGVEFKPYASLALPHARVVAIESEREFGMSVLRGLEAELTRRAALFRSAGVDSIETYHGDDEPLPRIVLVCDEFQVLFAYDDRLAQEAAGLLDALVRQGRAFGIHLVLGTQTLQGMAAGALIRGTLELIPVRIALKMGESDSRLFLSEGNDAGARLSRPGEAVLNVDSGRPEGNIIFQVAWTGDDVRDAAVARIRSTADLDGYGRRPLVFDGSVEIAITEPEAIEAIAAERARGGRGVRLALGQAVSLEGEASVLLSRQAGRNLLVVSRDDATTRGLLSCTLLSLALAQGEDAVGVTIVDCLGIEEEGGDFLEMLTESLNFSFSRRVHLTDAIQGLAAEVKRRIDNEEYLAPRVVLLLNGLRRARDLGDEPVFEDDHPRSALLRILHDGPDVGVHAVVTADSAETVLRRLGRDGLREFALRAVGRGPAEGSRELLDTEAAASLNPRFAFLIDIDDSRLEKIRRFVVPGLGDFREALRSLTEGAEASVVHPGRS